MSPKNKKQEQDFDVEASLARFKARHGQIRLAPLPERIAAVGGYVREVKEFCACYNIRVDVQELDYCVRITLTGLSGAYSHQFSQSFAGMLGRCDRFELYPDRNGGGVTVVLQLDTHDYYFGEKKLRDFW